MLRTQFQVAYHLAPTAASSSSSPHQPGDAHFLVCTANTPNHSAPFSPLRLDFFPKRWRCHRGNSDPLFSCKASLGSNSSGRSANRHRRWDDDDEFLQASVLVSETVRHYNLRKQGFVEETKWHSSGQILPLSLQSKGSKSDLGSIGHGFLRQFQTPTIFLKIACDGNLLLPIIVGEFAIERFIDTLRDDDQHEACPSQFHFLKDLIGTLGYEVKMARITKRVVNTYYAQIFLGKPMESASLSVDSRPSDAINVATRCKAPIYVNKEIVSKDAIKIVYGKWRGNAAKTVYDAFLDSAPDGPDPLTEELDLVREMKIAVIEERYKDAAVWRDKLTKLRIRRNGL